MATYRLSLAGTLMSWRLSPLIEPSAVAPLNSWATSLLEAFGASVAARLGAVVGLGGTVLVLLGWSVGVGGGGVPVTAWVKAAPSTWATAVPVDDSPERT